MADEGKRQGLSPALAFLLGAVVVAPIISARIERS